MSGEWKAASQEGRQPRWDIFTEAYIKQVCDEVAINNPLWNPDLYATDLSLYMAGMPSKKLWWVFPGSVRSSAAQGSAEGVCLYVLRALNRAYIVHSDYGGA